MAPFACVGGIAADRLRVLVTDTNTPSDEGNILVRRILALAADLLLVFLPSLILAILLTERFTILDTLTTGRPSFDAADQLRINEIDEGFNRAIRLGDTVLTLSGTGLMVTLGAMVFLSGAVFYITPGLVKGLTPGRLLLGFPRLGNEEPGAEVIDVSWSEAPAESIEADSDQQTDDTNAVSGVEEQQAPRTEAVADQPPTAEVSPSMSATVAAPPAEKQQDLPATTNEASLNNLNQLFDYGQQSWEANPQVTLGRDEDYVGWEETAVEPETQTRTDPGRSSASFEHLTLPESSLAESSMTMTTSQTSKTRTIVAEAQDQVPKTMTEMEPVEDHDLLVEAETDAAPNGTPEWSAEWQAWVYQDEATDRWFRHDTAADRWLPIR